MTTLQWLGRDVRLCAGHRKRALLGQPLDSALEHRASPGEPSKGMAVLTARLPEALKDQLEREAGRRGLAGRSEAAHQAIRLWLAMENEEVLERIGGTDRGAAPRRKARS